ncbi:sugar kinase [Streptomyces tubercidicus]|uniref:Ribokinase n=1 Tax=Streptomyces tubercidicus TaxID=47759 RepID=A0A640UXQ9_9ACTN|nr:sugar kinase [Streptomyces tubercidicus]WAU14364.1 sugar kinase [Streptomyces tubercidicus]GFE40090.1 ribokinase [Streptomyces tubercidicus]
MTGQPTAARGEDRRGATTPRPGATPGRPLPPGQPGRPDVFTFGETMVALRGSGPLKLGGTMNVSIAGAESNVAIGLTRLGHDVRWSGAVGEDEAGQLVLRTLRAEGVDVSSAATDPGAPTGLLLFEPRLPEVTRVHYYRTGSAGSRLTADMIQRAFSAAPPRVLHLTGITPSLSSTARSAARRALQLAQEHGSLVCLDVNFRARLWTAEEAAEVLREWIPAVDVLIASDDELPLCLPGDGGLDGSAEGSESSRRGKGTRTCADAVNLPPQGDVGDPAVSLATQAQLLLDQGVSEIVVKLGAAGARVFTQSGSVHRPAKPVRAVDAVGAGDAFVAGYLSALLDGEEPDVRLERAITSGAFAVASRGDWEGAPTRSELGMLGAPPGTVVR